MLIIRCSVSNIKAKDSNTESAPSFLIIGDNVNLRKEANIRSVIITKLSFGTEVRIIHSTNSQEIHNRRKSYWYFVRTSNGIEGWVFGGFISNYQINNSDELLNVVIRLNEKYPLIAYDYIKQVLALKAKDYNTLNGMSTHDRAIDLLAINECFRSGKKPYYRENMKDLVNELKNDFQLANYFNLFEKSSCSMSFDSCESDNYGNTDRSSFIFLLKDRLVGKKIAVDKLKMGKENATLYAADVNGLDEIQVTLNFSKVNGFWEWTSVNFCAD